MSYGFLIDMDGVIYREDELIPGANVLARISHDCAFIFPSSSGTRKTCRTNVNID